MNNGPGATVVELADRLWRAEVDRTPIEPITETRPDLTLADAYAIQAYNVRRRVEAGRAIRGCRLGRTSQPRQDILGVAEPDFGMLIDDMFVDDGEEVPVESFLQPRVVAEIGFLLADDLIGPGITTAGGKQNFFSNTINTLSTTGVAAVTGFSSTSGRSR